MRVARAYAAVIAIAISSLFIVVSVFASPLRAQTLAPTPGPILPHGGIQLPTNLRIQNKLLEGLAKVQLPQSNIFQLDTKKGSSIYQLSLGQGLSVRTIAQPLNPDIEKLDPRTRALIGGRVLLGQRVQTGQFAWQVALLNSRTGNIFCGGSYLGDGWIVTAAHCFWDNPNLSKLTKSGFVVMYGSLSLVSGGTRVFATAEPLLHEQFDPRTLVNDIALVRIPPPAGMAAAPLSSADDAPFLAAQSELLVTGWGQTTEGGNISIDLLQAAVPVTELNRCKTAYNNLFPISELQFCAGAIGSTGPDTCKGDSGGPISHYDAIRNERVVLGITSFGEGCGRGTYPGVYTRLRSYAQWIEKKTGKKF